MQAAEVTFPTVPCPQCAMGLAEPTWASGALIECPVCHASVIITGFPALTRPEPRSEVGERAVEGEAACFFHPEKKASIVCDQCGRFICALCDLPIGNRHVCPSCLETGLEKAERMPELVNKRLRWGQLALFISTVTPFFSFGLLAPLSGCAAIFCGVYGWNKPGSLVKGRDRVAAFFGILLGVLQLLAVVGFCMAAWKKSTR